MQITQPIVRAFALAAAVGAVAASGCGGGGIFDHGGAEADTVDIPMLAPFQGQWQCDEEKTFDGMRADGVSEAVIAKTRATHEEIREKFRSDEKAMAQLRAVGIDPSSLGKMHPDLSIVQHVLKGEGGMGGEYRLFALHQHGDTVCGKAWHHEDPNDPGDMSKCYVQLTLVGDTLHMKVRMQDGLPDLSDPDLRSPQIIADTADDCDAESPAGAEWSAWVAYAFVRPASEKK